jgi:hypothetical protein
MAEELNGKKLDELAKSVEGVAETVSEIKVILVGSTKNPDKTGLLERVRTIEKWIARRTWQEGIIIAQTIALIFIIIRYVLLPK